MGVVLSVGILVRSIWNFSNQPFSKTQDAYQDNRHVFWQVFYGALSSPVWVPIIVVTNIILGVGQTLGYLIYSFCNATNLTGNKSDGKSRWQQLKDKLEKDERPLASKLIYGMLTLPLWAPFCMVTNIVWGSAVSIYNMLRVTKGITNRGWQNTKVKADDKRHLASQLFLWCINLHYLGATWLNYGYCRWYLPVSGIFNLYFLQSDKLRRS